LNIKTINFILKRNQLFKVNALKQLNLKEFNTLIFFLHGEKMIGISTSYFASRNYSVYESVEKAYSLGFRLIELGAAHSFEENLKETVQKIKDDFSDVCFTLHGLFPPLREKLWFNPSLGLTEVNKGIIDSFFEFAEIVDAKIIGFHPGFLFEVSFEEVNGIGLTKKLKRLDAGKSWNNLFDVIEYFNKKNSLNKFDVLIENITSTEEKALVYGKNFSKVFSSFPSVGLLFDLGHSLSDKTYNDLMQFSAKIQEIHLHKPSGQKIHLPIEEKDLELLKPIKQIKKIPVIIEHFKGITEKQILEEKELFEGFFS
jgi:sugar phosphate isomerase/epimerase